MSDCRQDLLDAFIQLVDRADNWLVRKKKEADELLVALRVLLS